MMKKKYCFLNIFVLFLVVLFFAPSAQAIFEWQDGRIKLLGYVRHQTALRIQGPNEGKLSMLRTTLKLEPDIKLSDRVSWHAIFRVVKDGWGQYGSEEGWFDAAAMKTPIRDDYWDEDDVDEIFREFYFDVDVTKRLHVRIGRQVMVWGETLGFRMLDIINPLNLSWRYVGENEFWDEQYTGLSALRATYKIYELNGAAELIFIPGFEHRETRVNQYAPASPVQFDPVNWTLFDQRHKMSHWNANDPPPPPFITFPTTQVRYDYPELGTDHFQVGFRWLGQIGGFSYTIADFYSFNYDPIARYRWGLGTFAPTADPATWISGVPVITEVVLDYPRTNVIGGSFNWYSERLNTVFMGEFGYWDALEWNSGNIIPYYDTVVKQNTLKYMLTAEGNYFIRPLNPTRTFYINFQLFQTILLNYKDDNEVLHSGNWPATIREVETIVSLYLQGHYRGDRVEPDIFIAYDVNGSWWFHPTCRFMIGDHWRIRPGVQIFMGHDKYQSLGLIRENDEVYLKITYQF